ncbi:HD domain-containing protein [Paenibacillus endoradicis]|uniref:HD domain-containing protein n=1 Tax=Paenibacillus endoradicis TaxID=2972487 RepID=UPI002158BF19|nr:HD domain-containing protein [Paenibacillus endoradicis]MCR8659028.1 HD domain-containing protein [Paenibacillus endoradicis]
MNNSHYVKSIFQMQYVSRWQEFSPRYKDNAASHSFRCGAIAVLISIIETRLYHKPILPSELIGKALLHDLNETVTGSIKYVTKKEQTLSPHIQKLENEVNKELVAYLSKSLQPSFTEYIVQAEDNSYTGNLVKAIDSFDAMLFCRRESNLQHQSYFTERYEQLRNVLMQSEFESIRWLLLALEQDEGIAQFLDYILNLDLIDRWGGSFNLIPDNDATHSFRVAALCLFNAHLEKEKYNKEHINMYAILGKSIMHDVVEGVSGDVASPIKRSSIEIKQAFINFEQQVARDMVSNLPAFMQEDMMDFLVHAKDDSYEGMLVEIADKLDALIKSNLEMRNNPHYVSKYEQQLTHIQHHYENPSVIFFLAYILHDITYDHFMR